MHSGTRNQCQTSEREIVKLTVVRLRTKHLRMLARSPKHSQQDLSGALLISKTMNRQMRFTIFFVSTMLRMTTTCSDLITKSTFWDGFSVHPISSHLGTWVSELRRMRNYSLSSQEFLWRWWSKERKSKWLKSTTCAFTRNSEQSD